MPPSRGNTKPNPIRILTNKFLSVLPLAMTRVLTLPVYNIPQLVRPPIRHDGSIALSPAFHEYPLGVVSGCFQSLETCAQTSAPEVSPFFFDRQPASARDSTRHGALLLSRLALLAKLKTVSRCISASSGTASPPSTQFSTTMNSTFKKRNKVDTSVLPMFDNPDDEDYGLSSSGDG
ncbi:hypothetical protein C8R46DRAFT_1268686 [Mycena filopes]|nr:hypothetical protein C8R46DRAFT_1268686 [Mycena filopes]